MQISIIGKLKSSIEQNNELVGLLVDHHIDFANWYHDRFLKWDGLADSEDERVLNESIQAILEKMANSWSAYHAI